MQRKLDPQLSKFRSLSDSSLIIDAKKAVLTVKFDKSCPESSGLYLEVYSPGGSLPLNKEADLKRRLYKIDYRSPLDYGDQNAWKYQSTRYGAEGPGIDVLPVSQVNLSNTSCFIREISLEKASQIFNFICEEKKKFDSNITALDFFRKVLIANQVIDNINDFHLVNIPQKKYLSKTLNLWHETKHSYHLFEKEKKGSKINYIDFQLIDDGLEDNFAAMLFPSELKQTLSPTQRLNFLCQKHYEKAHIIDWNSEEGQNIQFLQDMIGVRVFCYGRAILHYLEKSIPIPLVLFDLVIAYALTEQEKNDPFYDTLKHNDSRCLVM